MAFHWGSEGSFSIDSTEGGSLSDISGNVKNVKPTIKRKSAELPRLGNNPTAQLVGNYTAEFSVELHGDETMDAIFGVAAIDTTPTTRSLVLGPFGTTSGLPKYTAEVYVAEYEPENSADDPHKMTAKLVVDSSGLTRGTY